jgi:hypothetical protein
VPHPVRALVVAVILQPLFAALLPRPSLTYEAEAARPPARTAAVLLAAVAAQAHEEPLAAKRAEELELRTLFVHPRHADGRELDAAAGSSDKEPFSLSGSASRAPGANRGQLGMTLRNLTTDMAERLEKSAIKTLQVSPTGAA